MISDQIIEEARRNFGAAPRRFSWFDQIGYLNIPRPSWYTRKDELSRFFANRKRLLEEGVVVWGHLVQANRLLFTPGTRNSPGEVVFCLDFEAKGVVPDLGRIAGELFDLKETRPEDPASRRIADHLTNELTRAFGLEVPATIGQGRRCVLSTVLFVRKHLPRPLLSSKFFPLIVSGNDPRYAMVLPARYWPKPFASSW